MKIGINFLLRNNRKAEDAKSSVCVRITYLGNRIELATGIYSSTDHWDIVRQRIKDKVVGARVDNERLDRIKTEIQDIFNQLRSTNEDFDANTIKRKLLNIQESKGILAVFDYYLDSILAKLNKGYSMETYKHHKSSRKRLADFINSSLKKTDISAY